MNRNRSYYRKQRKRAIRRKERILLKLGGKEYLKGWAHGAVGRFAKGKIHCSCPMCRLKSYEYPQIRDLRKADDADLQLRELETTKQATFLDFGRFFYGESKMIELTGTKKERIEQAIRLAYTEVRDEELTHFRETYRKVGVPLLPSAEAFYRKYGGVFRKQYLFLDDPKYNRDVSLDFYTDISDSEQEVIRRFEEAMSEIDMVRDYAKQDVCPVGDIGFYYPACVYIGANGLLYCVFEYKEEIEIHREPSEILEEQLGNHLPVGLDDYPVKTHALYEENK